MDYSKTLNLELPKCDELLIMEHDTTLIFNLEHILPFTDINLNYLKICFNLFYWLFNG